MLTPTSFYRVSELTSLIREDLDRDPRLSQVWVKGEISNYKMSVSGHAYFTLKDEQASLKCVLFRGSAQKVRFDLEDGLEVLVQGRVSVYEPAGAYQLYVNSALPAGSGDLYLAFEQLKKKLEAAGYFETKRPIPVLPRRIGIVTSATGSVLHDIINVATRRNPLVQLVLAPASVQGEKAPAEIAAALEALQHVPEVDVIVLARGGGSFEELSAFNTEVVARAIHGSAIPVVSGVGHETDFSIADMTSDLRAPTPSAAAELVVPDLSGRLEQTGQKLQFVRDSILRHVHTLQQRLDHLGESEMLSSPVASLHRKREDLSRMEEKLRFLIRDAVRRQEIGMGSLSGKLEALNPLATLGRGYAWVEKDGHMLTGVRDAEPGDRLRVRLADGWLRVTVEETKEDTANDPKKTEF